MQKQAGFTLIELIITITIIGILTISVAPKISSNNNTARIITNQLIEKLRFTQIQSMNSVTKQYGIRINTTSICSLKDDDIDDNNNLIETVDCINNVPNIVDNMEFYFNDLGKVVDQGNQNTIINISDGNQNTQIKINSEGYIYEQK